MKQKFGNLWQIVVMGNKKVDKLAGSEPTVENSSLFNSMKNLVGQSQFHSK
jgi:hypothetical protein